MAGIDMLTIKELGGWKTLGMVTRYAHLSPDHKQAAVECLIPTATDTTARTEGIGELPDADNLLKVEGSAQWIWRSFLDM